MSKSIKEILLEEKKNKKCIDCENREVTHVSVNNGITLCSLCAENHKQLGYNVSYVRSIEDKFDSYLLKFFELGGNKKFKNKLKKLGVNLDMKKMKLYKTAGVDYYRRYLKAKVKDQDKLEVDFDDPNEIKLSYSNSFPEFEDYQLKEEDEKAEEEEEEEEEAEDNNDNDNFNKAEKLDDTTEKSEDLDFNTPDKNDPFNMQEFGSDKTNKYKTPTELHGEPDVNLDDMPKYKKSFSSEDAKNMPFSGNSISSFDTNEEKKKDDFKKTLLKKSWTAVKAVGKFLKKEGKVAFKKMKKAGKFIAKKAKPVTNQIKKAGKYVNDHLPEPLQKITSHKGLNKDGMIINKGEGNDVDKKEGPQTLELVNNINKSEI